MRNFGWLMAGSMATCALPTVAAAQNNPAPQQESQPPSGGDYVDENEIVVTGEMRGSLPGDIKPEQVLSPADIRAYGVGSIAELLTELEPQTRSGRGRGGGGPVLLLSGRRISSFAEIRDIPPEAIERMEILPEEAALKLGYRADQRVVNIVLRRQFRSITAEVDGTLATDGGRNGQDVELSMLRLNGDGRINLDVEYERDSRLLESDRNIITTNTDSAFRTLTPETQSLTFNGVVSRNIGRTAATANLRFEQNWSDSLLGLPIAGGTTPLARNATTGTLHGGFSFNGDILPSWRWSVTGNWDRVESRTVTDTNAGLADRALSVSNVGSIDALLSGPIFELPAGDVSTTVRATARTSDLSSESRRGGVFAAADIGRDTGAVQANIDLPIASRGRDVLSAIGNLSLNANMEVEELSDFGTLFTYGYGANWSPIEQIRFIASFTEEEGAPSAQQLGNPVVSTPNVRVFDFVRGETVDITRVDGGNAGLIADNRSVTKLGLYTQPISGSNLWLNVEYNNNITRNPIAAFPTATAELEAAFPDRFFRDGTGQLFRIDNRPVNFQRSQREQIRWGMYFSKEISSPLARKLAEQMAAQRAARQAEREGQQGQSGQAGEGQRRPAQGAQGAQRAGGFRGFGGRGGGAANSGRLQFSVFHTLALTDRVTIRDGLPELDLLNGSATGSRGGSPRHQVDVRTGITRDGMGIRLNVDWQSATTVRGGATSSETLRFDDFATVDLRLFASLGPQFKFVRDNRWLMGTRVSLSIDNLFNNRLNVTDQTGATPLSYQPGLLDPVGRTVRISLRKVFF